MIQTTGQYEPVNTKGENLILEVKIDHNKNDPDAVAEFIENVYRLAQHYGNGLIHYGPKIAMVNFFNKELEAQMENDMVEQS